MNRMVKTFLAAAAAFGIGTAGFVFVHGASQDPLVRGARGGPLSIGIHGLRVELSTHQRIERSDAVVVGTPVKTEVHKFRDVVHHDELDESIREGPIYSHGSFREYTIAVSEVIKGSHRASIRLRRTESTPNVIIESSVSPYTLEPGQRYVLILSDPGGGIWQDAWLTSGPEGIGSISGDIVAFPAGDNHTLAELREMANSPAPPLRYEAPRTK